MLRPERSWRRRGRLAARALAALIALLVSATATAAATVTPSAAATPASSLEPAGDLGARLSIAAGAMEYWDLSAWLDSDFRLFARFLVTNQGPGVRTAAAVGHLVLPGNELVPFQWGRRSDDWTLGPGGGSLKIAKARLQLDGPTIVLDVDSKKHNVVIHLELARSGAPIATRPLGDDYAIAVVMPAPAEGRVQVRGMNAPRAVTGTAALTHTWMEVPEGELLRQRNELFARAGDVAFWAADLIRADGGQRGVAIASRAGRVLARADDALVGYGAARTGGDREYPVATEWQIRGGALQARAKLRRELLRMNPLDLLPQPFRFLLALGAQPQRVWADAEVDLTVALPGNATPSPMTATGVAALAFARPVETPASR